MELARFVESALRRTGGLTEVRGADLVYAVLPPAVATALGVAEEARLRLFGTPGPDEAPAGYGSNLLSQICSLGEGTGRRHRLELAAVLPKRERVERDAQAALCFQNAVARVESLEQTTLHYLVADFRYAALCEETQEGLLTVALDPHGGSSPRLANALPDYIAEYPDARRAWAGPDEPFDLGALLGAARALALTRAAGETQSYVKRLERRLARDVRRVEEYYDALRKEVDTRRGKVREDPELLSQKRQAIETERQRRQQGLRRRYTVTLRLEPIGVLAVRVTGLRLECRLQRRKGERRAQLGWNPVARQFDRWLCEGCGDEAAVPTLCDKLHLLCSACPPACLECGRPACPACRTQPCPCGRQREQSRFVPAHPGESRGQDGGA